MNWIRLSKGEQKTAVEVELARRLDEFESADIALTDWQKAKLVDALDYAERGAFGLAATAVKQVTATNVSPMPWGANGPPEGLELITIEKLRALLLRLKGLPVQEPVIFGRRKKRGEG